MLCLNKLEKKSLHRYFTLFFMVLMRALSEKNIESFVGLKCTRGYVCFVVGILSSLTTKP